VRKGRNERSEAGETKNDIIKRFAADKNVITIFNQFVGFPITFFFLLLLLIQAPLLTFVSFHSSISLAM